MKRFTLTRLFPAVIVLLLLGGCSDGPTFPVLQFEEVQWAPSLGIDPADFTELPSGIWVRDDQEGTGATVAVGNYIRTHYRGFLTDGTRFDSSLDGSGRPPLAFTVGSGEMIQGFDRGARGMQVGGVRTVLIPSFLGYGSRPTSSAIPPNAWLVFEIHLVEIVS
ncbi:MAG: FKBP-type peptidyl-prolyl cis-trans isomerase [Gemmatimonadales bacterium]|nr:MAG: FKBP-type peptidyl-prolyl cis-trans isomerase [Gemmatimonadales bacterium]